MPQSQWQAIEACLQRQEYPAQSTLLQQGQVCRYLYFLESGYLRFYTFKDGEDVTKFFTEPPYCFTSQRSLTQQAPAREGIETLTPSTIWLMPQQNAFELLEQPAWSTFVRLLVQEVQYYTQEILEELQSQTAEQRYLEMLETQAPILQVAPLKHLASYLGIAPQSLSRIRKKLAQKDRTP